MGTYINVLVDHQLADYREVETVQAALAPSLPAALAVSRYWKRTQSPPYQDDRENWDVAHKGAISPSDPYYFKGPGSLFIDFTDCLARIHTGGRWRGFLSIEELHSVHLQAFRAIATALAGTTMVFYPDNDLVDEAALYDRRTQDDCIELLHEMWGPAQPDVNHISDEIVQKTDSCVPQVWYREPVRESS